MSIETDIVVDWDNDGFGHRLARVGDPINMFDTMAADMSNFRVLTFGIGGAAGVLADVRYESDYGKRDLVWETGTNTAASLSVGWDGADADLNGIFNGTYSAAVWMKFDPSFTTANDTPITVSLVRSDGVVLVETDYTFPPSGGSNYVRIAGTGTTGSFIGGLYLKINKDSDAEAKILRVTGAMIVQGSSVPTGFNSGIVSTYDNLRQSGKKISWNIGFRQPYKSVGDVGRLSITLNNEDKTFSPENTSSVLTGLMKSQRRVIVKIYDTSNVGLVRPVFKGWIDSYQITTSDKGPNECTITASDVRKFLERKRAFVETQIDKTAREIAQAVIDEAELPGEEQASTGPISPETYDEEFPYALDNCPDDGFDVVRVLADVALTVGAKIYFDRDGRYHFDDLRDWSDVDDYNDDEHAEIDNSMIAADYRYGDNIINESTVVAYKRKASATADKLLFSMDETMTIGANDTETIRVSYKNPDTDGDKKIGATDTAITTFINAALDVTLTEHSTTALIEIENTTAEDVDLLELELEGRKLTAFNEVERTARHEDSIAEGGIRAERIDTKLHSSKQSAKLYAEHRVNWWGDSRGEMISITLRAKDTDHAEWIRDKTIGDTVHVVEDQTVHDGLYKIVGEKLERGRIGTVDGGYNGDVVSGAGLPAIHFRR